MQEKTKDVYLVLQDITKNVWEQQKYSELKNSMLLTLHLAIFVVLIRVYAQISVQLNTLPIYKYSFIILMILLLVHILYIVQSFFPKLKNHEKEKCQLNNINIFFFGDIAKLNNKNYLAIVLKKINKDEHDIDNDFLLDLSNQIVILSEITESKYKSFKNSIRRMYMLGALFLVYFGWLFLKV